MACVACGGGDAASDAQQSTPPASPSPSASPAATVDDFHADWCGALLPYVRLVEARGIIVPGSEPRVRRGLDQAVTELDALSVALADAGLEDAAAKVRTLADRIAEQAELSDQPVVTTTTGAIEALEDAGVAARDVRRGLSPAVDVMGPC